MLTFHPAGIHHGPQPGAVKRAAERGPGGSTDEVAINIDARRPLHLTEAGGRGVGRRIRGVVAGDRNARHPTDAMGDVRALREIRAPAPDSSSTTASVPRHPPSDLISLLGDDGSRLRDAAARAERSPEIVVPLDDARLLAPDSVSRRASATSTRSSSTCETARERRGLEMEPDWYELPVFYFSNPASIDR